MLLRKDTSQMLSRSLGYYRSSVYYLGYMLRGFWMHPFSPEQGQSKFIPVLLVHPDVPSLACTTTLSEHLYDPSCDSRREEKRWNSFSLAVKAICKS